MKRIAGVIVIGFLFLLTSTLKAQDLQALLNNRLTEIIDARKSKNAVQFINALSVPAYIKLKNTMLSSKKKFPEAFYDYTGELDLTSGRLDFTSDRMEFVSAKENGTTANLIYYDQLYRQFIVTQFINEGGQWNFYEMKRCRPLERPDKIADADCVPAWNDQFNPSGIAPVIPHEIKRVDYMAFLNWSGVEAISVKVNNVHQDGSTGKTENGLLIGGINKGHNRIEIEFEAMDKREKYELYISIHVLANGKQKEVFALRTTTGSIHLVKEFEVQ